MHTFRRPLDSALGMLVFMPPGPVSHCAAQEYKTYYDMVILHILQEMVLLVFWADCGFSTNRPDLPKVQSTASPQVVVNPDNHTAAVAGDAFCGSNAVGNVRP